MSAAPRRAALPCPHCWEPTRDGYALDTHLRFWCTVLRPATNPDTTPVGDRRSPLRVPDYLPVP